MKTYFQNGIVEDIPHYLEDDTRFYIQELQGNPPDKYIYPGDKLKYELDSELVSLYDKFRDLFFHDPKSYYAELDFMPIFVQEAGQSSECSWTVELFNKVLQEEKIREIPNIYKHLYLVDCQFLVGTIQNLLSGMEAAFVSYYTQINQIGNDISPSSENATMYQMSPEVGSISALLENYFIKAYSILDMLCKIAYEFQFSQNDFSAYKKLKSADILWGARKDLTVNNTHGTVFEKCDLISTIESLRNEVVHNGSWELNPKVFVAFEKGVITERYMLFPDIVQGHLATSKNRRHFFGDGIKVNEVLPRIHINYQQRILNTVKWFNSIAFEKIATVCTGF